MSGKWGGGGAKCTVCTKTVYPAETVQYEKKPYHVECFRCVECDKKMENASKAANYEDKLYCTSCFSKNGFAQKQKKVVWEKKESTGGSAIASKFGGGGNPCTICSKTVYPAETLSFDKAIYHQACFKCNTCDKVMTASGAAQFEGTVYCTKCFKDGGYQRKQAASGAKGGGGGSSNPLASKFGGGGNACTICTKTVYTAEALSYDKKIYHAECFKCTTCNKTCTPSGAAAFEDQIFCTKCFGEGGYRQKQAASGANKPAATSNPLASKFGGGGNKCVRCTKTVYPAETVSYEKNFFHSACFTCLKCDKQLTPSGSEGQKQEDGSVKVYCKKCWGEEGLNRAQLKTTD